METMTSTDLNATSVDLVAEYDMNCFSDVPKIPFVGLRNLGNTCFFNSIIQMLYYCPGFQKSLYIAKCRIQPLLSGEELEKMFDEKKTGSMHSVDEARDKCTLLLELCELFIAMKNKQELSLGDKFESFEENCTVRQGNLIDILRKVYPAFAPYTQQDAQECLRCILGILQDALSLVLGKTEAEKPQATTPQKGGKLFGGRKLDPSSQASTSAEQSQIENRDPSQCNIKQESRSTALRKSKVKSFLKRPMKIKKPLSFSRSQPLSENNKITEKQNENVGLLNRENVCDLHSTTVSIKEPGCLAKLKKKNTERKVEISKKAGLSCTPTKRPNSGEIPSTSPAFKRQKLSFSNGIKNFYKPIASSLTKTKMYGLSEKKSYTVLKSDNKSRTNPFKVVLKVDSSPKYKLLDLDNAEKEDVDSGVKLNQTASSSAQYRSPTHTFSAKNAEEKLEVQKPTDKNHLVSDNEPVTDFVEDLFQGQLVNETRCMECEGSIERKETFMDISLPVKEEALKKEAETNNGTENLKKDSQNCSVTWGMSEFTSHEILEGENKYYCEHCTRYVEGERRLQFASVPPILTLHLKRFTASKALAGGDAFCSTVSKINSSLNVPLKLCLSKWCTQTCKERATNYVLYGIVIHSGVTISSGHYLSYIHLDKASGLSKDANSDQADERLSSYEGSWLEADDDNMRILSAEEFKKLLSPRETEGISRTPYLLFYRRTT